MQSPGGEQNCHLVGRSARTAVRQPLASLCQVEARDRPPAEKTGSETHLLSCHLHQLLNLAICAANPNISSELIQLLIEWMVGWGGVC